MNPVKTIRVVLAAIVLLASAAIFAPLSGRAATQTVSAVYGDSLQSGWADWSWGTSVNLSDTAYRHGGTYAASAAYTQAWGGLYFGNNTPLSTAGLDQLTFWVNGGAASGQAVLINLVDSAGTFLPSLDLNLYIAGGSIAANQWRQVTVPLADLQGANASIGGIVLADGLGGVQPRYYVDDMQFSTVANATPTATATSTSTVTPTATGTPPTATRTSIPPASPTPAPGLPPIPGGVPNYFSVGLFNANTATIPTGVPWNFRYQYLAGGVNTGNGWATWNPNGGYATNYINDSRAAGLAPAFIYYQILQSAPSYDEYQNLQNTTTMRAYYDDFKLLMQKCGQAGGSILIDIEPDLTGVMQQHSSNTGDNAALQPSSVASSGQADVQGYPNTFRGVYQALAHIRDLYAPNVSLGIDISSWGATDDISLITDPTYNWQNHATRTATYLNSLGPGFQLTFYSPSDRDSAYYQIVQGSNRWWDDTNSRLPNFNRMAEWLGMIISQTGKRAMMWQVPNGNRVYRSESNTSGHWQDNRPEYFLNPSTGRYHMQQWANYGVLGLMFGAGVGDQSHYFDSNGDGITNPAPINGNNATALYADDDGGYIRLQTQAYYSAGTVALPGGGTLPTATPTSTPLVPTATRTAVPPTATSTAAAPTATATWTSIPARTPTATWTSALPTSTPTRTPTQALTAAPTNTRTGTPVPTATAVPPTSTSTALPPTATSTSVPPTATNTAVPPTATSTAAPPTLTPTAVGTPYRQAVTWTDLVNVSPTGNSIRKTQGGSRWNAGAASINAIASGDGYVEVTANSPYMNSMFGLSNGDNNASYTDIDFGMYMDGGGVLQVYESGVLKGKFIPYGNGDVLRVAAEFDTSLDREVIRYYKNGVAFYTSRSAAITYPLLLDTSIYRNKSQVVNAFIEGRTLLSMPVPPGAGIGSGK